MNNIKRVLSVVLCVLMMVSMLAVSQISFTFAATENGYTYTISAENTATVTAYNGTDISVIVPETLGGAVVTAVGDGAFMENDTINSITFPATVITIGESAFLGCSVLNKVNLPADLTTVGYGAFMDCAALETLVLGDQATVLGANMLSGCNSLKELTIATDNVALSTLFSGTTYQNAVYPATLKTVTVTNDTQVEANAFRGMNHLETVNWTRNVNNVGNEAFADCTALKTLNMSINKKVGRGSFMNCKSLKSIVLQAGVTEIGASAFAGCTAMEDITAGKNLKTVAKDAFKDTPWLKNQPKGIVMLANVFVAYTGSDTAVTLPNNTIGTAQYAMKDNTTVRQLVVPDSVTYIGSNLLTDSQVEKVTLPYLGTTKTVAATSVVGHLFGATDATANAEMPSTLKEVVLTACATIPQDAFKGSANITKITIPQSVTSIEKGAFANCAALQEFNYNAISATIATDAFAGTSAKKVNFGENVEIIPSNLCVSNSAITEITIPAKVTEIQAGAFNGCYNLKTMNYNAVNCTSIAGDAFDYCHRLENIVLGSGVKHIPANLYSRYSAENITELTIPEQITSIASKAFSNCAKLTTLNYNALSCDIGEAAFAGCSKLANIVLGAKVTTIPSYLYQGNTAITSIEIPANITRVDDAAFAGCSELLSIKATDNLVSVGADVLKNSKWYELQANGALYLGKVFIGYKGTLAENGAIEIAAGTIAIADKAFNKNNKVQSVFIPASVTHIGTDAFKDAAAKISCHDNATYVIEYAVANNIPYEVIDCPETVVYYEIVKKATQTEKGIWNKICKDCAQELESGVEYAYGEDANVWVLTKAPTCTVDGVITKGTETQAIAATGHKNTTWKQVKAPSCVEEGKLQEYCNDCKTALSATKVIEKLPHTPSDWTITRQPRTYCTGINAVLCTECGAVLKSKELEKLPENPELMTSIMDVSSDDWYYETVKFVLENNLFSGTAEFVFSPTDTMNRAMFVTVLGRMAGVEVDNAVETKFTDVSTNQYYTGYVAWASKSNIVSGVTETKFCPYDSITREQICAMIVRYANYSGVTLTAKIEPEKFADANKISDYAYESVMICQKAELIKGRGENKFAPRDSATRAEVAQILKNLALGFFAV